MLFRLASTIDLTAEALRQVEQSLPELAQQGHWQERYRRLMQLAKQLPVIPEEHRPTSALIDGCESRAWLMHYHDGATDKHYFLFESDARIVKALLAVLLCQINGMSTEELKSTKLEQCLQRLHLTQHLSQSRARGLTAVIQRLKKIQSS
ncbi:SufE family protein [Alkalimonas amylolytica]|uniref:Cysteine desulfuration protein SufE n=1 Tax=Alkalimonas amylolytica TaxID=152573 RepID=A0A1H3ZWK1_ALKAM|nr:SufE family protein [Alkalimonas amylolytica]SEA28069.1 cysteine desulfuration protein SufE [Alkalimonas amylolytica]